MPPRDRHARGAACLCGVYSHLQGTVGQGFSMFMRCLNLPPRDCRLGVKPVYAVSVPTSRGLSGRGAACLCRVRTYLGISFIAKPALIIAIDNASKP